MLKEAIPISLEAVVGETAKIKVEGYRFVTMSCTSLDENKLDILYHFDKDLELKHFRLTITKDTPVPSISPVYLAAFLVENEIQDLFGVRFSGLALDYGRTFYLEPEVKVAPFCKYNITKAKPGSEPASEEEG
jgi:ech hydrogenase subunit D